MNLALAISLLSLALVTVAAAALWLALARRRDTSELAMQRLSDGQNQLAGALSQLALTVDQRLSTAARQLSDGATGSAARTDQTLTQLGERLAVIDAAQKKIAELSQQVVGLQDILANKQARGAFGEIQLENLVQSCLPPSAYQFQATLGNGRRADCLLTLPNPPGSIAIDAKFPLESYRALRAAEGEAARSQATRDFSVSVREHILAIEERYIIPGETAESALMFLPSEAVYAELHSNFTAVVEESYRARVWIVSPTTLMATLNTVRAVLKDVRMREQAGVIQEEVHKLLVDVGRLDERVTKLGTHFEQAQEDVRQIRISTDKVVRRGERIEAAELGAEEPGQPSSGEPVIHPAKRLRSAE